MTHNRIQEAVPVNGSSPTPDYSSSHQRKLGTQCNVTHTNHKGNVIAMVDSMMAVVDLPKTADSTLQT